ncbi:Zn-dependent alcohol dehydrogenase [Thermogemmatispora sp.]|uniref:Zn-dependent alcohol dehydrogenase n=1 Tax=Thermogemmatispora sp. TaxID=1968838 RepID=UPI001DCF60A8|nr:Zn-dependent alcohol dehydrogenase [Thermogemmatispora sp.]MBX5449039.1 Zn-dependent alcohol dehydrogenase [Thermogemmatispora sp.]
MKTRTAVIYEPGTPIRVEEIELDPPKEQEVLVRMVAAGVCHSDYHVVKGDLPAYLPMALGHEGAGIVEQVGPGVSDLKPGDHVLMSFIPACGSCPSCVSGHSNLCDKGAGTLSGPLLDGTFRMHGEKGNIGQFCYIGSFSEYTVVPAMSVVKIADYYPLNRAVLVSCGVPTGVGSVIHRARVTPGSTVMVIGCGGIGMNIVQGAAIAGARMIIAVDIHDFKLEKAKEFGATHTINASQEDPVNKALELTWGVGVDYAFEAIATPETIAQAFNATAKNGTVVVAGLSPFLAQAIPISPLNLVLYQKTLMGTLFGDSQPRNDIPMLLRMYESGKLKLDELVTRTYKLDQINEAYEDLLAGRNIRGVIEFS